MPIIGMCMKLSTKYDGVFLTLLGAQYLNAGAKLMINTIVGDIFDMQDTGTALACANIASSITAGSAFVLGEHLSVLCSAFIADNEHVRV